NGGEGATVNLLGNPVVSGLDVPGVLGADSLVESANVCLPTCDEGDDGLLSADVVTGETLGGLTVNACAAGDCGAGSATGNGLVIAGISSEGEVPLLGNVDGAACVAGACEDGSFTSDGVAGLTLDTTDGAILQ